MPATTREAPATIASGIEGDEALYDFTQLVVYLRLK